MKNTFCPNFSDPKVRQEFDELVEAVGENAAYYLWDQNNGYSLDYAPNGAQSKLFSDLLQHYDGNRKQAIISKAKTYSTEFKNWFGDWQQDDKTNVSKVVDENGEPLLVYHSTTKKFDTFDISKSKNGQAIWFKPWRDDSRFGTRLLSKIIKSVDMPVYLNLKNPAILDKQHGAKSGDTYTREKINKHLSDNQDGAIGYSNILLNNKPLDISKIRNNDGVELVVFNPNQIKSIDNRGTYSNEDNNIYRRELDSTTYQWRLNFEETVQRSELSVKLLNGDIADSSQLIDELIKISENNKSKKEYEGLRDVIFESHTLKLLKLLSGKKIKINIEYNQPDSEKDTLAFYNGEITIYRQTLHTSSLQELAETIAHELLHHYLLKYLTEEADQKTRKDFQKLKDKMMSLLTEEEKSFYGMSSNKIDEFINEFMANEYFRRMIYEKSKDIIEDKQSLWKRFITFIAKFLNIHSETNVLDELNNTIEDLLLRVNKGDIATYNSTDEYYDSRMDYFNFKKEIDGTRQILQEQLNQLNTSYQINTKEKIDEQLSKLRKSLSGSMEIKLNTLDIVDLDDKAEAEANIKYLISQLNDENINDLYAIFQFTKLVNGDLPQIAQEILDAYNNKKVLSDERILSLDRNFFGFYSPMMREISDIIDDLSKFEEINNSEVFQNLKGLTIAVQNVLQLSRKHLRQMQTENFKRIMIESNLDSNDQIWLSTINEFINGDILNTNKDITQLTRLFMSPDRVNDNAMKTLYKLLQTSQNNRRSRVFKKSVVINNLLEKVKGGLDQFYERDNNGKYTGQLIRDKKYGLFNNDMAKFMQQLRIKFGMKPSDLTLPEDPVVRAQFAKLKNEFLSHRVERKYTSEFYELMDSISTEAQAAREQIDQKIRLLKDTRRDKSGYFDESKLTPEDRDKLQTLEIQKKLLKSKYYTDGTLKTGVDLQIAEDLSRISKALGEDYITVKDTKRFEKIRAQKQKELSPEEYEKWYNSNTKLQYTEEFRKELEKLDRERYGAEYVRLAEIRNDMLAPYRDYRTNEIIASKIPAATKNYLNKLERLMSNERRKYKGKKVDTSGLFKMVPTQEYFELRNKAMQEATINGMFDEMAFEAIFYMQTSHKTNKGWQPNSYYLKLVPVKDEYLERVPNDNFNVLSPDSKFYNKNFDHNSTEYYQPKAFATEDFIDENGKQIKKGDKLYDNSTEFKKVMASKENRDFYNELVATMKEANDYYYNRKFNNNYLLPQIEGSMYRYMKAKGIVKGFLSKIGSGFVRTNEDTQMKEKVVQSPDKQKLNLIPQYYTKRLEDPALISADLVGIVMEYYDAAINFDEKTKIRAKAETIKAYLGQRTYNKTKAFSKKRQEVEGTKTQIYQMADTFLDMQLYDRMNSLMKLEMFGKEINITKLVNTFRTIGTYVNLAANWAVAATGGLTGAYNMLVQSIVGRYYDWNDTRNAMRFFVTDMFWQGIRNIGNRNYKSKQWALMDEAEVGSELRSRWQNSNHYGPLMTILRKLGFWGMSVVDYCVKGQILDAVMYNHKYVNGEFICKEDYLDKYGDNEQTRYKWHKYKSAMDCIEYKNGKLRTIDQSMQEAWDKSKHKIYNIARAISSSADGQLTPLQKAQFTQNAFGGLVMMHRQYIPVVLSERYFMQYQYDPNLDRHREAVVGTIWRYIQDVYKDRKVYGLLNSAIKNYKEFNKDKVSRASIRQGITEAILLLGILPMITNYMLANADENDNSWWAKFLAYVSMRVEFESKSPYNLLDIINTIKNPTPLFGLIDNFQASVVSSFKQMLDLLGWTSSEEKSTTVTRGAYKDWEKWQRNLFKLTPLKNPYEQYMDIDSKIRYYKTQIMNEEE